MKIFLVGLMAVGKTTIGKKLASRLHSPFIDLDQFIEQQKSMSVADLFSYFGENFFRQAENDCLRIIGEHESVVVACGGGAPCYLGNMDWMNEAGVTIYLQASPAFIASRVKQSKTPRPLFKNVTDANRLSTVQNLFAAREAIYRQAAHTINVEKQSVEETVTEIIDWLEKK